MSHRLFTFVAWGLLLWLSGCVSTTTTTGSTYPPDPLVTYDYIYEKNVRTVQFYRAPVQESYPVLYLAQSTEFLVLEFDELLPETARETDFFVDIISCTAEWDPSGVLPIEFYEGFTNNRIGDYQRSSFTKVPYVHYRYQFPRENEGFKRSGNYLLKVFRNGNPKDLVLTRRFVVVDQRIRVQSKYELSSRIERQEFQQFAFEVNYQGLDLFDPVRDLNVQVLQNFRWDNAVTLDRPRFQGRNSLEFLVDINRDYRSGQEFRFHGIESVRLLSRSVQDVEEGDDYTDFYLFPDRPVKISERRAQRDRNGSFTTRVDEFSDNATQADYTHNFFYLKTGKPLLDDQAVYLFGEFTDWQCRPEFRLTWDAPQRRYQADVLLKQGIYDYQYVVKTEGDSLPDPRPMEGSRRSTENFYSILVYFRPPGERADQLIAFRPVNYYE